ncbi:MAG: M20 family metallopeptidase [Gammaproteobacteria bacterium]|nr:M20 family metallopeptidase [Gammaproteobacteria bacterium]
MNAALAERFIEQAWDGSILPRLMEYIRIPNKSPHFDADWRANGHMENAVGLAEAWCREQRIRGLSVEVVRLENRTPVLFMEIPGQSDATVLLYGHLDKQPEMTGWREGLGPWTPVVEGDRLYGRGGADDGYAVFASLTAIRALQEQGMAHARCVVLIECCEESGSYDLPRYVEALRERIGDPSLVVCLDSGCGNYEQLWCTTSLRGMVGGTLTVEVLTEGVHSGDASGVVPSSFRVLRRLMDRLEDTQTGQVRLPELEAEIPKSRRRQAARAAQVLGDSVHARFPFQGNTRAVSEDPVELILNRTWRPTLCVTGVDGLPPLSSAGNVLRPFTALKLSLRLPPNVAAEDATEHVRTLLEAHPPCGAEVRFEPEEGATGWNAPPVSPWLEQALEDASMARFGKPAMYMGEGGTIPFIGMLGEAFPEAQFLITGVLGPQSNAHGPNEFLHIPTAKRLTACVADVLAAHLRHVSAG